MRVLLAGDESPYRASLRQLLSAPPSVISDVYGVSVGAGFQVVGEAGSAGDALRRLPAATPDLLLVDFGIVRLAALDALRDLTSSSHDVRTILLADAIERTDLVSAVSCGVHGVVLKDAATEVLLEAITCVMTGRCWLEQRLVTELIEAARPLIQSSHAHGGTLGCRLTRREREVLTLIVAGYGNKEIASASGVGEDTIKHHLTRMFDKCGVANRLELALLATECGLLDQPSSPSNAAAS